MKEKTKKYRDSNLYNLNCAEAILYAANEHYNLGLTDKALTMVAGFGGGVKEGHLCGIVSGAVAVLSILFKNETLNDTSLLEITLNEFKEKFREQYDEIECNYLKENYKDDVTGCNELIVNSAQILEIIIDKYLVV